MKVKICKSYILCSSIAFSFPLVPYQKQSPSLCYHLLLDCNAKPLNQNLVSSQIMFPPSHYKTAIHFSFSYFTTTIHLQLISSHPKNPSTTFWILTQSLLESSLDCFCLFTSILPFLQPPFLCLLLALVILSYCPYSTEIIWLIPPLHLSFLHLELLRQNHAQIFLKNTFFPLSVV